MITAILKSTYNDCEYFYCNLKHVSTSLIDYKIYAFCIYKDIIMNS